MTWRPAVAGESFICLHKRWLDDKGIFVPCDFCSHCRAGRGKDWAGRAIAESKMADRTLFSTLTVGGDRLYGAGVSDNARAQAFHREDVQKYVKRVRKYILPGRMRMFWVGENGDRKGRVHYHMLAYLYGTNGPEDLLLDKFYFHGRMEPGVVPPGTNIIRREGTHTYWPWGLTMHREFEPRHAYYLSSYVTKAYRPDEGKDRVEYTRPGVSTKPLLGAAWFKRYALRHVGAQLAPQGRTYSFARGDGYKGPNPEYWMGDATWRLFLREYVEGWRNAYGERPFPGSPALEEHLVMLEDERAGRRPYDDGWFNQRMEQVLGEKAEFRAKLAMSGKAAAAVREALAMQEAGIMPAVKRDGVDDALNAALAISDQPAADVGNGVIYGHRDRPSIAQQEAEWRARFGSFEDHEKRWQMEVLRKRR